MRKVEMYLSIDKDALTEERAEEYKQMFESEKEGYVIDTDLTVDEIAVEEITDSTITISGYNDNVYLSLVVPLDVFLRELIERDGLKRIIQILKTDIALKKKVIEDLEYIDSVVKP